MPPADAVFLDTNGWIALLNASDSLHGTARVTWESLIERGTSLLLTEWVVAETGNGLARTAARRSFPDAVGLLRSSPRVRLVPVSTGLLDRALDLYGTREDKTWGLVDCASFVLMRESGVGAAFTNDRHFKQAGFRCLLPLA